MRIATAAILLLSAAVVALCVWLAWSSFLLSLPVEAT